MVPRPMLAVRSFSPALDGASLDSTYICFVTSENGQRNTNDPWTMRELTQGSIPSHYSMLKFSNLIL